MTKNTIEPFCIIGIAVRTTNENGRSAIDIPLLWNKFITERVMEKIPGKIDTALYCMYTNYEKDHTKPYTTILGCKVEHLQNIPAGMTGKIVKAGNYIKYTAKGNLQQGIVFEEWTKIWNSSVERSYTTDFEIYGEKAKDPENAEVDIFIAVK